jgi:hypothetical protein
MLFLQLVAPEIFKVTKNIEDLPLINREIQQTNKHCRAWKWAMPGMTDRTLRASAQRRAILKNAREYRWQKNRTAENQYNNNA